MSDSADQAPRPPGDTQRWIAGEDRFWKMARRRREIWKNVAWLVAGIGLAILLNQLGCLTPT
jgi:hypothetical protein